MAKPSSELGVTKPLDYQVFVSKRRAKPELSPQKIAALQVVELMQRAQQDTPAGEPIGAYRAADAPSHHIEDVPEYLYEGRTHPNQ
jgi:hypothetical protein